MAAGATLAEAYVRLRIDQQAAQKDITTGLGKAGEQAGKKAGSGFSKTFKAAAAGLAGLGAISFFKGAIDEGIEAQKVGAQTTAVLKSTGGAAGITSDQIGNLATAISNKIGVDDEAIQSNENLLLTFTNIRNEVGKGNDIFNQATQTVSDMSAALGQDGKSSAIQLGKALNDPIKGITALSRVGVSFTDQQKKAITTAVKHGDTLKAQKIILGELTKEFGGSAAAVATPGDKMKVAWGNLQETIGTALLPTLGSLATTLTGIIQAISPILAGIGKWIQNNQTLTKILVGVIAGVWALNVAMEANVIGLIVLGIAALVAALVWVATKTKFFQTIWKGVWGFLKGVGHWFAHDFVGFFVNGWKTVTDKGGAVLGWFKALPGKIGAAFVKLGEIIIAPYRYAFNKIADLWNGTVGKLSFHVPSWVPGIGGKGFSMPSLPHLASGGMVPATPGGQVIVAGEGGEDEFVIPRSKMGALGGGSIEVRVFIGDQELRGIVRTEVDETNRGADRSARAGAGARSTSVRYA